MSKKTQNKKQISNWLLLPAILMMGFIPVIVHTYNYNTGLSQFDWFPNSSESRIDVFFAWKMVAIIAVGAAMLGIFLYRYFKKKESLRFENAFYLLFFYAGFAAMSALFSPYKYWVMRGTYELFESIWVLFSYIILCYYTYNYMQEERQIKVLLGWAGIGMMIVTLIGAFQYFGLDFFKTSLGKHLITSPEFWDRLDEISFTMGVQTSYTTLYNPNFLSLYFGMLVPLAVCLIFAAKKIAHKIILLAAATLSVLCLEGSGSDSGWLAIAIAVFVVVMVLLSRRKKTFYIGIGAAAAAFIVILGLGYGSQLFTNLTGTHMALEQMPLHDIETNNDNVVLDIRGKKMILSYGQTADGQPVISCTDENGTELARTCTDEASLIYQIDDASYEASCQLQPVSINDTLTGIRVTIDGRAWDFVYNDDGYYYLNPAGKLVKYEPVKTANLFLDDALSGRGRIWNTTIPLLPKRIFIGAGANAYLLDFPQNDYIYQAYAGGVNNYDVKAHCWYLQQWVENGLIGLILLLIFLGWYLIRSIRIYRKASFDDSLTWVGIGLFTAILAYLTAGLANDSNVCTAPVFWGMIGLGMAVNRMLAEKEDIQLTTVKAEADTTEENRAKETETPAKTEASVQANTPANAPNPGKKKSGKKKANKKNGKKRR